MSDPLSAPKASDSGTLARFRSTLLEGIRKRVPKQDAENMFSPAPGVFDRPSTLVKGTLKAGRDFQHVLDSIAYSGAEAAGLANPEMKVQDFEAKKALGKVFGGPSVKIVDEIIGSRTSNTAELPIPIKVKTPDGRTVFVRPGDLEVLKLVNDQRARDGRPPLPSPLDPANTYDRPSPPAHPVIPPTTSALPVPAIQDTVAVARPNDKQPEPPGRPVLVRFIDP